MLRSWKLAGILAVGLAFMGQDVLAQYGGGQRQRREQPQRERRGQRDRRREQQRDLARELTAVLDLSEDQQNQLRPICQAFQDAVRQAREETSNKRREMMRNLRDAGGDRTAMREKFQKLQEEQNKLIDKAAQKRNEDIVALLDSGTQGEKFEEWAGIDAKQRKNALLNPQTLRRVIRRLRLDEADQVRIDELLAKHDEKVRDLDRGDFVGRFKLAEKLVADIKSELTEEQAQRLEQSARRGGFGGRRGGRPGGGSGRP